MTYGDLKQLVADFAALPDDTVVVVPTDEAQLVEFHLHDAGVIGLDNKNKQCAVDNSNRKVLRVFTSTE